MGIRSRVHAVTPHSFLPEELPVRPRSGVVAFRAVIPACKVRSVQLEKIREMGGEKQFSHAGLRKPPDGVQYHVILHEKYDFLGFPWSEIEALEDISRDSPARR